MQDDSSQKKISNAILIMLRPLARILLRCGIGFREFSELSKIAFVDVASQEYGIRGRPTNISRVAVMTGLTRKEVRRVRDTIDQGEPVAEIKTTPLAHVLRRWHSEAEFTDANGRPLPLDFDGDGATFTRLVRLFGGDIPPGAMRTEFKRVGAVEESDGKLHAKKRIARPEGMDDRIITCLLHGAYPLLSTIANNLSKEPGVDTWPQLTAWSKPIRKSDSVRLLRISRDRLEEVAASFDDLFLAYESLYVSDSSARADEATSIAVGLFYFEESDHSKSYIWNTEPGFSSSRADKS